MACDKRHETRVYLLAGGQKSASCRVVRQLRLKNPISLAALFMLRLSDARLSSSLRNLPVAANAQRYSFFQQIILI